MISTWQHEHQQWAEKNFPNVNDASLDHSLHGIMEEVGELAHAHLKAAQGIRGTKEEHTANAKDAVGDALVYLMGLCNYCDLSLYVVGEEAKVDNTTDSDTKALHRVGALLGIMLDSRLWVVDGVPKYTRSEMRGPIGNFYRALERYCVLQGWDMVAILGETWAKVKQRDWVENPVDADVKAELEAQ